MLVIFFLLFLLAVGALVLSFRSTKWAVAGSCISILSSIALFVLLVMLQVVHAETKSLIVEHKTLTYILENTNKESLSDLERAKIIEEVLETNIAIRKKQYWNGTIWDIYIPDKIMELEMIK